MKIEIIKPMMVSGKPANTGDVVEVSERDGFYLTNRGFAELVKEKKSAPKPKAKAKK